MRGCERLTIGVFFVLRNSWRGSLCRCVTSSEWNVEGGRQYVERLVPFYSLIFRGFFLSFSGYLAWTVGLTGWAWLSELCRDAGKSLSSLFSGRES